jgi:hypothetical protein
LSKLPTVAKEVIDVIAHDIERQYVDTGTLTHLIDFWRDFKVEQPALAQLLLKEIKDARSTIEKGYIAHGAWMVYKALKVQSEADEMNKLWGQ